MGKLARSKLAPGKRSERGRRVLADGYLTCPRVTKAAREL